jgi:hypothetical protein
MRTQQDKVLPEATKSLNFFYGDRSIVLYSHKDEMGVDRIAVIFSEEGPRMGCTAGSFLFGIAIQPVYEALRVEFPNVILVAHTDDLLKAVLPPGDGEDWGTKVAELHKCNGRYDELANPIGIYRNLEKSEILLPTDVDQSSISALAHFPKSTNDGLIVVGVPIGTDLFVKAHALEKAENALHRGKALLLLADEQPKMAMNLLGCCINAALDYCGRTIPTQLMSHAAVHFDTGIHELRTQIMTPPGATFAPTSITRAALAIRIASLPLRHGGLSYTPAIVTSPLAFYSATLQCLTDRRILEDLHLLTPDLLLVYKGICDLLPPQATLPGHKLNICLPTTSTAISDGSIVKLFLNNHSKSETQKIIGTEIADYSRMQIRGWTTDMGQGFCGGDENYTLAITSRSQASRAFVAPSTDAATKTVATDFIPWIQYLLPARCRTAGKWRWSSSSSSSGSRDIDEGLPRWVGLSMMGPLLLGSRKSSALALRRGSRRSSQGLLDGLWHPRGSLGHSLDKAAHDAVRWALKCLI